MLQTLTRTYKGKFLIIVLLAAHGFAILIITVVDWLTPRCTTVSFIFFHATAPQTLVL
jgi:hypothetical protein